jgi:hypothetical protein
MQFTWDHAMTNVIASGCYKIGLLTAYGPDTVLRHSWSSKMKPLVCFLAWGLEQAIFHHAGTDSSLIDS